MKIWNKFSRLHTISEKNFQKRKSPLFFSFVGRTAIVEVHQRVEVEASVPSVELLGVLAFHVGPTMNQEKKHLHVNWVISPIYNKRHFIQPQFKTN